MVRGRLIRLAIIVSHPIQYYAPLHQRLARRRDLAIKVFFTWHDGRAAVQDRGFGIPVAWDIPLTDGYEFEQVPNISRDPGMHHFFGLRNPSLVDRVMAWNPDVVQINGWAWYSHLLALRAFHRKGIRTLFRGDSHLLDDGRRGPRWWIKRETLRRIYSWPSGFLVVGSANREYYATFGCSPARLYDCPHSIDVGRFAECEPDRELEAVRWRKQIGIDGDRRVVLFAGKFERKKQPLELMRAVLTQCGPDIVLVMIGDGELDGDVKALAWQHPERFRVLPFQNQSRMPVVYRLGDLFVLPSAYGETWGLAVNEALACGRPVLVSDRVGCAPDVVDSSCGRVFSSSDSAALGRSINEMLADRDRLARLARAAKRRAWAFDIARTEETFVVGVRGERTA